MFDSYAWGGKYLCWPSVWPSGIFPPSLKWPFLWIVVDDFPSETHLCEVWDTSPAPWLVHHAYIRYLYFMPVHLSLSLSLSLSPPSPPLLTLILPSPPAPPAAYGPAPPAAYAPAPAPQMGYGGIQPTTVIMQPPKANYSLVDVKPPNYLILSIITMLCFCWIFGLIALIVGSQVRNVWVCGLSCLHYSVSCLVLCVLCWVWSGEFRNVGVAR